jgi:hypothetical protein
MNTGNVVDATRYDPYGEMGHVKALPIAEAVEAYVKAVEYSGNVGRVTGYPGGTLAWDLEVHHRTKLVEDAAYCVLLSGFAARTEGKVE